MTTPTSPPAPRTAEVSRNTAETKITVRLNLDGTGQARLSTGIGFFDHMLDQIARHGLIDLDIHAEGDLHIDGHHTVEDVGITLGQAVAKAVGDKKGDRKSTRLNSSHITISYAVFCLKKKKKNKKKKDSKRITTPI